MKIRIYLKSQINGRFVLEGEITKEVYEEMCSFTFASFTLGKITVMTNEINGWEILE